MRQYQAREFPQLLGALNDCFEFEAFEEMFPYWPTFSLSSHRGLVGRLYGLNLVVRLLCLW